LRPFFQKYAGSSSLVHVCIILSGYLLAFRLGCFGVAFGVISFSSTLMVSRRLPSRDAPADPPRCIDSCTASAALSLRLVIYRSCNIPGSTRRSSRPSCVHSWRKARWVLESVPADSIVWRRTGIDGGILCVDPRPLNSTKHTPGDWDQERGHEGGVFFPASLVSPLVVERSWKYQGSRTIRLPCYKLRERVRTDSIQRTNIESG
jgi:hypothetical protein